MVREDYQTARDSDGKHDVKYSLFYQLTRMTREKGAVAHDDRLDALALGIEWLRSTMELDAVKVEHEQLQAFLEEHMEKPLVGGEAAHKMAYGGIDIYYEDDDVSGTQFIAW